MLRVMLRVLHRFPILLAIHEALGMGLAALRAYKLRAALTVLGIVMGILTVTGMSGIIAGLNRSMASQIQGLGASVIFIRNMRPGENISMEERRKRRGLTLQEIRAVAEKCPAVRAISPVEIPRVDSIKYGEQKVQDAVVLGADEAYETVNNTFVEKGRFLSAGDVSRRLRVAVIGADIVDTLFPVLDPIDKLILIDGLHFRIIGVLERRGKFLGHSRDNLIIVPLGSLQKTFFNYYFADVTPISPAYLDAAMDQVRETLRRERRLRFRDPDTFALITQDMFMDMYRQVTSGIYLVMIAISSIGLVVGGVGVMNIMLVSVTERTREIGVRKALGATRSDIRWQFLIEAMLLTGLGGVIGVLAGGLVAWLIDTFSPFPAAIQPFWVAVAFGTSLAIGLVFGLWPAARAARLDPVEALRYE